MSLYAWWKTQQDSPISRSLPCSFLSWAKKFLTSPLSILRADVAAMRQLMFEHLSVLILPLSSNINFLVFLCSLALFSFLSVFTFFLVFSSPRLILLSFLRIFLSKAAELSPSTLMTFVFPLIFDWYSPDQWISIKDQGPSLTEES